MSKIEYDMDSSGGLMSAIQALIKPPNEETPKYTAKKTSHPYYKRPGRGHNHDVCDACDEGGNLICCDRCPASFHLGCHDPPLCEDEIPNGQWICHTCRMTQTDVTNKLKSEVSLDQPCSDSQAPETDVADVPLTASEKIRSLRKRSSSRISVSSDNAVDKSIGKMISAKGNVIQTNDPNKKPTALDELIRAASLLNPKQFELPREMNIHVAFPGTDKVEPSGKYWSRRLNRNNRTKPHELDAQGLVPLPAKTCFYCKKSCKKAPLVACDYCPLFFHQDCLDPPLTALPTGLWMCPNHAEQFIDMKLVNSISATERIKLWNRYIGPVDQETVKAEFFRKVHCKNPPFRFKVKSLPRDCVDIPAMIEYHYQHPPPLLPSLRDVLRCESICMNGHTPDYVQNDLNQIIDENLNGIEQANNKLSEEPIVTDLEIKIEDEKPIETTITNDAPMETGKTDIKLEGASNIDEELKALDLSLIKLLAFQRLQQIIIDNPVLVQQYQNESANKAIRDVLSQQQTKKMPLPSQLLTKEDIERIAKQFTSPEREGKEKISSTAIEYYDRDRVNNFKSEAIQRNGYSELRTDEERAKAFALSLDGPLLQSKIRARAVLIPVGDILSGDRWFTNLSMQKAAYMRYRSFNIGSGPNSDLVLTDVGQCAQVSKNHAVIFYDDSTQHFELINYSEFGTEVNGQLFSCDFTEYIKPQKFLIPDPKELITNVRNIIDKRRGIKRKVVMLDEKSRMSAPIIPDCSCKTRSPMTQGWEGTAILSHGCLLKFGCLAYVFSIVDNTTKLEPDTDDDENEN